MTATPLPLPRLAPYLVPVRRLLVAGLAATFASAVLAVVAPWILKYVVDGLLQGIDVARLTTYASLILAASLADGWLRLQMRQWLFRAGRDVESRVRRDVFAHLTTRSPAYFESARIGALTARMTEDTASLRVMLSQGLMHLANYTLGFAIAVAAMLWIDAPLTVIALLPFPAAAVVARLAGRAARRHMRDRKAQSAGLSTIIHETLTGMRLLKAARREERELRRFRLLNDEYSSSTVGLISAQALSYSTLRFSFFLSTVLVLWFGGADVIAGRLTLGEFVAFGRYQMLLGWPVTAFGWTLGILQSGALSWGRILEVLDARPAAAPRLAPAARAVPGRRLEARRLSFRYPDGRDEILSHVSFSVGVGEVLAIVGPTGSGKSTLVQVLCGLLPAPPGTLFVDDVDAASLPQPELRRLTSVAAHGPFIFRDTIAANIAFGLDADANAPSTRAIVARSAALADLARDVADLPDGYDTVVAERGVTLSGGQRQRVALARAITAEAPMLILDDALSEVDSATERRILDRLIPTMRSRICIIVAHRISTVHGADRILVLDRGRIVESGGHQELLAGGGVYAAMCRRQSMELELSRL